MENTPEKAIVGFIINKFLLSVENSLPSVPGSAGCDVLKQQGQFLAFLFSDPEILGPNRRAILNRLHRYRYWWLEKSRALLTALRNASQVELGRVILSENGKNWSGLIRSCPLTVLTAPPSMRPQVVLETRKPNDVSLIVITYRGGTATEQNLRLGLYEVSPRQPPEFGAEINFRRESAYLVTKYCGGQEAQGYGIELNWKIDLPVFQALKNSFALLNALIS